MMISGRVHFSDDDVAGCLVSNGQHVVSVACDGTYTIPWDPDRHRWLCVIPPNGCGVPKGMWRAVGPQADAAVPTHFALQSPQRHIGKPLTLLHVTDFHVVEDPSQASVCAIAKGIPRAGRIDFPNSTTVRQMLSDLIIAHPEIDFVVSSGDLTDRGDEQSLAAMGSVLSSLARPIFPLFGGHDGNDELERFGSGLFNASRWLRNLSPPYYAWNWGGRHFLVIVSEEHYLDQTTQQMQREFIHEDLCAIDPDIPITICAHQNPTAELLSQLKGHRVDSWIHGHFHSNRVTHVEGIRVFSTGPLGFGCLDGNVSRARLLRFEGDALPVGSQVGVPDIAQVRRDAWRCVRSGFSRIAGPTIVEKRVICPAIDDAGGDHGGVSCIDQKSGIERWFCRLGDSVEAPVVVAADRLIAVTHVGTIACIRVQDGQLIWKHSLPEAGERWIYAPPLLSSDRVIAGTTSALVCLRLSDGQVVWQFSDSRKPSDIFGQFQGPLAWNDRVFIAGYRSGSYLLNAHDGSLVHANDDDRAIRFTSRVVPNGKHYVVGDGNGSLTSYDMENGRPEWRVQLSESLIHSAFVPFCGGLLGGTAEGAVSLSLSGDIIHRRSFGWDEAMFVGYRSGGHSCLGAACVDRDLAWIASGDGYVNCLRGLSLELVDRIWCGAAILAPMAHNKTASLLVAIDRQGKLNQILTRA